MPQRPEPHFIRLSLAHPFVAHLHPWEAKTKVEKKSRRRRSPSRKRNPHRDAKYLRRPLRNRAELDASPERRAADKGVYPLPGEFFAPSTRFAQPDRRYRSTFSRRPPPGRTWRSSGPHAAQSVHFRHLSRCRRPSQSLRHKGPLVLIVQRLRFIEVA